MRRRVRAVPACRSCGSRFVPPSPTFVVPEYDIDRVRVGLEPSEGQGPPLVVAALEGTVTLSTYAGSPPVAQQRAQPEVFEGPRARARRRPLPDRPLAGCEHRRPRRTRRRRSSSCRRRGCRDCTRRRPSRGRRAGGRARLPPQRVRLPGLARPGRDDGRRALLARLRRRRLARPVRRQLVLHRARLLPLEGAGRPSAQRPVPQRGGSVRRREPRIGRRRGAARQRLRRGGFQPRRPYRLYVTAAGYDALLWNEGDGRFSEGARDAGIAPTAGTRARP